MDETIKSNVFYQCPNNCSETWFYHIGTMEACEQLTEDGQHMEYEHFEFTPAAPVRCRKCNAEAIVKNKTVRTIVTIE